MIGDEVEAVSAAAERLRASVARAIVGKEEAATLLLAALDGRRFVLPDDVKRLAEPVLAHRLSELVNQLHARGVGFKSLTDRIDTTTSGGKLTFHVFGALAEFERDLIRERTQAGLAAERARGRLNGRPRWRWPRRSTTTSST
jgi:DNA invertase Pin-like site-specific DNA recombinase